MSAARILRGSGQRRAGQDAGLKPGATRKAQTKNVALRRTRSAWPLLLLLFPFAIQAQSPELSKTVQDFVRVQSARVVLAHVRIIDGTGAPAVEDQNIVIAAGKISAVQKGADVPPAAGTTVLDLRGSTVMPGIVGMHNHLFYIARPNLNSQRHFEEPLAVPQMMFSAPRLYLAAGVTTMRTTGSVEPYADLNLRRDIDAGKLPGPHTSRDPISRATIVTFSRWRS
jgi:hypothetical protein